MKQDLEKNVNDSMNIIFDTINDQIYITSSLGNFFETVAIPINENLTRIKLIDLNHNFENIHQQKRIKNEDIKIDIKGS